jgi:imidazolonepropionase-like amidohydrolase
MMSGLLRRASRVVLALAATALAGWSGEVVAADATLALVGGRVVDGYGGQPLDRAIVLIDGNRIVAVGTMDEVEVPASAEVLDFSGMTVLPGLWESHGHLFHIGAGKPTEFQQTFAAQAKEVMAAAAKANLLAGITSFRDTGGPLAIQLELRADIEARRVPGPRLYFAGPILHQGEGSGDDADNYVNSARDARSAVARLVAAGVDQVKVYGFWDQEILEAVVDAAHEAGVGVDADVRHRRAYITAVKAGVDRLHHVFAADPLSDYSAEDLRLLIGGWEPGGFGPSANIIRGPYILPTVEMRQSYVRAFNFPGLLDHPRLRRQYSPEVYEYLQSTWEHPAAIPWGIGAPERVKVIKRKLRRFIEAGGREQIVAGTDAGAPFNLHSPLTKEIRNLHEAGLSSMEAIQAATLRPAQMQGVADDLGTVSAGKLADLIIVNGDPLQDLSLLEHEVLVVIKDGQTWFPDHNFAGSARE